MPARLRPTAPTAAEAILVGDPGRALMLAQELLQQPKMSNHARGLWGYTGLTYKERELTIQATGMGGPSATVVLYDLAELGVRRAVRIGTCVALRDFRPGELMVVDGARRPDGQLVHPDRRLTDALSGRRGSVASLEALPRYLPDLQAEGDVADMQTAALLATAARLGIAAAALLIVVEAEGGAVLADDELEATAKRAGLAAETVLSP